jgi:hypothetical protein
MMRLSEIFLFLLFTLAIACPALAAKFVASAEVNQNSLSADVYKREGRFYADVTVKNVSPSSQIITVWTNAGWSWVTDSKGVVTSQEAAQNFAFPVRLKPGEVYNGRLEMAADPTDTRPITFRLGFISNANRPTMDDQDPALIWSNPVSLPN